MVAPWVVEEMGSAELDDKRLNARLGRILDQLGGHPTASIPAACGGHAELVAAYRFFDNQKVDFERILRPHIDASYARMAQHPVVVLAQDTTELDLTRPVQQVLGAGPLDGSQRRGVFLHPLMGFTPDGTPLGTIYAEIWARDDENPTPKSGREQKRRHTPIEAKESVRWVDSYREANRAAQRLPDTQFVCVADSEADIYELLQESQQTAGADWIIRACQNRALRVDKEPREGSNSANHLREHVIGEPVLFTHTITVHGRKARMNCEERGRRQPRESRIAEVEVRAAQVVLRAPWRHDRKLQDVAVNVVLVTEVNPPVNDEPIEWILLTSLPIDELTHVPRVIQYYCIRWMIEVFFRTLKSGCRAEQRRFEELHRFSACLAVYLIVTWRTLFVCRLGREFPEISCEAIFEPAEWKSLYQVVHKKPPPSTAPKLRDMIRMVAQLGGYVNRKRVDDPGPQTVWLGMQRLHDIATCWVLFGPENERPQQLV